MVEGLLVVLPAMLAPVLGLLRGVRTAGWLLVLLVPVYMYHKSMFGEVVLADRALQWPTLAKDAASLSIISLIAFHWLRTMRPVLGESTKWLGALAFFALIAVLQSAWVGASIQSIVMGLRPYVLFPVVGLALGYYLLKQDTDWERLARIVAVGSAVLAAIALVHRYVTPSFLIHPWFRRIWAGQTLEWYMDPVRLHSIFTAPNTLGYFMALGLTAVAWLHVRGNRRAIDWFLAVTAPLMAAALLLTLSRTALIALGAAMFVLLRLGRPRKTTVLFGGLLLLALVLIGGTTYAARFADALQNPRLQIWLEIGRTLLTSSETILFGFGLGSLGRFGLETTAVDLGLGSSLATSIGATNGIYFADNAFIRAGFELGLLGIFYGVVVAAVTVRMYQRARRVRRSTQGRVLALPIGIMVLVLTISVTSDSLTTYPWSFMFWLCLSGALNYPIDPHDVGRSSGARGETSGEVQGPPGASWQANEMQRGLQP